MEKINKKVIGHEIVSILMKKLWMKLLSYSTFSTPLQRISPKNQIHLRIYYEEKLIYSSVGKFFHQQSWHSSSKFPTKIEEGLQNMIKKQDGKLLVVKPWFGIIRNVKKKIFLISFQADDNCQSCLTLFVLFKLH